MKAAAFGNPGFVLGDHALYARLCSVTEVLGRFVSCAPRAMDVMQLAQQTGQQAPGLIALCGILCGMDILRAANDAQPAWLLACNPGSVTLEDAFRCALMLQAAAEREEGRGRSVRRARSADATRSAARNKADMLVTQAMIGIDQSVLHHLRQFSLDRLRAAPATAQAPRAAGQLHEWAVALG